ncbi:putative MFS family arabinose efflux permease [Maritalea mobilis]|uniref:Putative MFS family arabinose efflux permease n=1 Tax=Maritalea mobilis TaxID=483324 RepID=A0A4R6VS64_9HYPH|nr:putative MFS family arabinose efflux permease [Maritalea mobilis]
MHLLQWISDPYDVTLSNLWRKRTYQYAGTKSHIADKDKNDPIMDVWGEKSVANEKKAGGFVATLRSLPPHAQFFIVAITLTRLTSFMVFPFLAVILSERLGATVFQIGFLFTLGAFVGLAASPIAGFIADGMRKKNLMHGANLLTIICFLILAFLPNLQAYFIAITLFSAAGGVLEPLLRSSLGELAENEEQRPALFHVRYYIVNIAGAVGPFIGLWFIQNGNNSIFLIAAASYILLGYAIQFKLPEIEDTPTAKERGSSLSVLKEAFKHRLFVALFISNLLLVFIYAQTDEPLTLHMINLGVPDLAAIIAMLTVTNTVVVLVIHGLFMKQIMEMGERTAFLVAIACLGLSLLMIAINQQQFVWLWVLAIGVSTLGEIIALPMFLTIVDRVAPKDQRNSFFGIYMLSNLGGAVAPLLAAQLIITLGGPVLFYAATALCLPLAWIGYIALKEKQPIAEEGEIESV